MEIRDSIALVTGASRGIGRALVYELLRRGARRVYAGVRRPSASPPWEVAEADRVRLIGLDITDARQIAAAAAQARDVNLLINNAGALSFADVVSGEPGALRRDMETNYFGPLLVTRAWLPALMQHAPAAVVNILSVVALASIPRIGGYCASKAAALSWNQALRAALSSRRIDVHAVLPGAVDTEMARGFDMPKSSPEDVAQGVLDGVQAGVEDILPDAMAEQVYAAWTADHKTVEREFAAMG